VTRKATQRSRGMTRLAAARRTCVDGPELAWARRPLQHPELMAENEDLEVLGSVDSTSPSSADEETDEGADDQVEEGQHRPIVLGLSERESGFPTPHGLPRRRGAPCTGSRGTGHPDHCGGPGRRVRVEPALASYQRLGVGLALPTVVRSGPEPVPGRTTSFSTYVIATIHVQPPLVSSVDQLAAGRARVPDRTARAAFVWPAPQARRARRSARGKP